MSDWHDSAAADLLAAFDAGTQRPPLSDARPLDMADGYAVAARIAAARRARGERVRGRKIGFTNRRIWPLYNVDAPIWGWVWDSALHDIPDSGHVALPRLPEPRLEPEIVLGIARSPEPGMDAAALRDCLEWIAHGVEIVTSVYPGWRFTAPDTAAAQGLHGALWLGERVAADRIPARALETFELALDGPGGTLRGHASDVLGGPLHALAHLVEELSGTPGTAPLQPGEVVTTGTLTDAVPIAPGQTWRTELTGIALPGLDITLGDPPAAGDGR